jgi:hypothetical protein
MALPASDDQPDPAFWPGSNGDLERFAARARLDDAIDARGRERWHRQLAADELTLAAVVADLAGRGDAVTVLTLAGTQHCGRLVAAGEDFVAVAPSASQHLLVPLWGLAAIQAAARLAGEARPLQEALRLADVLTTLSADRPRAAARLLAGGNPVVGELTGAGSDIAVIAAEDGSRSVTYLRLRSVAELLVMVSG